VVHAAQLLMRLPCQWWEAGEPRLVLRVVLSDRDGFRGWQVQRFPNAHELFLAPKADPPRSCSRPGLKGRSISPANWPEFSRVGSWLRENAESDRFSSRFAAGAYEALH
jgi:hypothetical protein